MEKCFCGSGIDYNGCCGRFIDGGQSASTAEELLRSRYTAHATKKIDYIISTVHPDNKEDKNRESLEVWLDNASWHGFNIVSVDIKSDDLTFIEFTAESTFKGNHDIHREISEFRKVDGKWYFLTARTPNTEQVINENKNISANDKCPCGSGKKYKKCCMGK